MKKLAIILGLSLCFGACNQTEKKQETNPSDSKQTPLEVDQMNVESPQSYTPFNIEDIALSSIDIGEFPFIRLPNGLQAHKGAIQKNFDVCFFPINGIMMPFEGKLYKANIKADSDQEYSQRYFEKSMEDYLESIGAVKVYDGEITKDQYDAYNKQDPNKGGSGDMGYWGQRIVFYIYRNPEIGNVFIQFTSNNAGGSLNVLQQEAFQQTITKITSQDTAQDLTQK